VATDDLPLTLNAGETRSMTVRIRFTGAVGKFQRRFVLMTDNGNQWVVRARISGRVVKRVST